MFARGSRALRFARAAAAAALGCAVLLGSTGCSTSAADSAISNPKPENPGPREQPALPEGVSAKQTALPADFPSTIHVPAGATVDDAGKRDTGWYLVLRATSRDEATKLVGELISESGLRNRYLESTPDPAEDSLYLQNDAVRVDYLVVQEGDNYLLSFDIAAL